ncbi:hypothetical protein [Francisella tularensis]|uniref:hypothetical protein n=1 Tax=Francisella tularensis TaxID=263 RepID=UPI0008F4FE22|nr:hypothetical protein [Francisella tularensis]APA83223.1 hypothetical protein N894_1239 [Francisella tularensis subsp. novicida PA10-7858]
MIKLGKLVHKRLNVINPIVEVNVLYNIGSNTDIDGNVIPEYERIKTKARQQSATDELANIPGLINEVGKTYRIFNTLDTHLTSSSNTKKSSGDYIQYNGFYYRVVKLLDNYHTGWQRVLAVEEKELYKNGIR